MGRRRSLGGLPLPRRCCGRGGSCAVSCFSSGHLRSGRWFVASLYLFLPNCPNCACMQLFSAASTLFSVAPGDVCPRASTPVKGPRSQPISLGPALTELSSQRGRWNSQQTVTCRGRGEAGGADAHTAGTAQRNCLSLSGGQGRLPGGGRIQNETSVMNRTKPAKVRRKTGNRISGKGNSMCQDTFSPGPLSPPRYIAFFLLF